MKNLFKLGLVVFLTTTVLFAKANKDEKMKNKSFEDKKMLQLEKLDTRINRLSKIKDCISKATKQKEITLCKKSNPKPRKVKKMKMKKEK